MSRDH